MFISRYFGIGSVSFYFLRLKLSLLDIKIRKAELVISDINANKVRILKTFLKDFVTGVAHRMVWTVLKTDLQHVALLTDHFFLKCHPKRFFSSLKKTIVLYLVKKFETFMVIFANGRKKKFPGRFDWNRNLYVFHFIRFYIHSEF